NGGSGERGAGSSRMSWRLRVPRLPRVSWRVLAWAGVAMIVMVSWMTAPLGLRRLQFFRVRQGEIIGIRFLDSDQVLAVLRLFQAIDAARRTETTRGDVLLELGGGAHRVLLNRDAGPEVIEAVVLVARDLAAKARPYRELDARFAGQVVVRRRSSVGGTV